MIGDDCSCGEIMTQLAAIKAAVDRVCINVPGCHLADCIEEGLAGGKDARESLEGFLPTFKKFS